jgi:hypothetical protein
MRVAEGFGRQLRTAAPDEPGQVCEDVEGLGEPSLRMVQTPPRPSSRHPAEPPVQSRVAGDCPVFFQSRPQSRVRLRECSPLTWPVANRTHEGSHNLEEGYPEAQTQEIVQLAEGYVNIATPAAYAQ